jgi:hypothetical protein
MDARYLPGSGLKMCVLDYALKNQARGVGYAVSTGTAVLRRAQFCYEPRQFFDQY